MVGGVGSLCDPLHSGAVEIFHDTEWGAICQFSTNPRSQSNRLEADVVCRQIGFPYATLIDPIETATDETYADPGDYGYDYSFRAAGEYEEGGDESARIWFRAPDVRCRGTERRLLDCDVPAEFGVAPGRCGGDLPVRLHVACRQFPVEEALESVGTDGAGAAAVPASGSPVNAALKRSAICHCPGTHRSLACGLC